MAKRGRKPGQPTSLYERRLIKRVMTRREWHNSDLAERAGVSERVVSFARNGHRIEALSHHAIMRVIWDEIRVDKTLLEASADEPEPDEWARVRNYLRSAGFLTEEAEIVARIALSAAA